MLVCCFLLRLYSVVKMELFHISRIFAGTNLEIEVLGLKLKVIGVGGKVKGYLPHKFRRSWFSGEVFVISRVFVTCSRAKVRGGKARRLSPSAAVWAPTSNMSPLYGIRAYPAQYWVCAVVFCVERNRCMLTLLFLFILAVWSFRQQFPDLCNENIGLSHLKSVLFRSPEPRPAQHGHTKHCLVANKGEYTIVMNMYHESCHHKRLRHSEADVFLIESHNNFKHNNSVRSAFYEDRLYVCFLSSPSPDNLCQSVGLWVNVHSIQVLGLS